MKRALLLSSLAAALAVGFIASWIIQRAGDAKAVASDQQLAMRSDSIEASPELPRDVSKAVSAKPAEDGDEPSAASSEVRSADSAAPSQSARFRGRLVYESTRDPVPWCIVAVRVAGKYGSLRVTDKDGHFTLALDRPDVKLEILATDLGLPQVWDGARVFERAGTSDTELEIAVRMWPTIVIDSKLPRDVDARALEFSIAHTGQFPYGARATPTGSVIWRCGSIYEGDPWIAEIRRWDPPWELVIEGPAGWHSAVQLEQFDGVVRIVPQWEQYGSLQVKLHTNLSRAPHWIATLRVRSSLDSNSAHGPGSTADLGVGVCLLQKLDPGESVLQVTSDYCERVDVPVTIRPGETTSVDVTLACAQPLQPIRGVVRSESGKLKNVELKAALGRVDAKGRWTTTIQDEAPWNQEGDVWVARFQFPDVPKGEYFVRVMHATEFAIRPDDYTAVRPGDEAEFTLLDAAPTIDLGFRVSDKSSGAQLDGFDVQTYWGDHVQVHDVASNAIALTDLPLNGSCKWTVSKSGYTCVSQGLDSVSKSWNVEGRTRWVRVELERGAEVAVEVRGVDDKPLSGATVLIDDREAGRTDQHGRFDLLWSTTPKSVDVHYFNWRHVRELSTPVGPHFNWCGSISFTLAPP